MNQGMKYLVFNRNGIEMVFVFPFMLAHKDFAGLITDPEMKPIRGGLVWMVEGQLRCYGEAFSLGLQADKQKDLSLLTKCLSDGC